MIPIYTGNSQYHAGIMILNMIPIYITHTRLLACMCILVSFLLYIGDDTMILKHHFSDDKYPKKAMILNFEVFS